MSETKAADVRNFALLGHSGTGKTTLVDAILYKLGVNDRMGSTTAGSSVADYTDEEKGRKITIFAKPFSADYKSQAGRNFRMVFIDTPGYMDFYGQVISALSGADAAVIAVDASAGIQVGATRAWKSAANNGVTAKAILITGIDRENADYQKTLDAVRTAFGDCCVPVTMPMPDKSRVIDVLAAKEIPAAIASTAEAAKTKLVELAAETNDSLIEKFLAGESLAPDELAAGLINAVASGGLVPVFACSAIKDIGVTEFLEGVTRLLPPPTARKIADVDGKAIETGEDKPLVGYVWRSVNDSFVGQLTFVRVFGGVLTSDSEIYNAEKGQKERVGALICANGKKQANVNRVVAGEIVAIPKLKATSAGETLTVIGTPRKCPKVTFPKPVMFLALRGKTQGDEDKLGTAIARICEEDPTLHIERNRETKEFVLQGLGDVHLDVAVEMMRNRSNVHVLTDTPKVPYRETVQSTGEGHYKHKKQSGGRGQYGEVYLRVSPRPPEDTEWFSDDVVGGVIPGNFMPAIQKGLVEGMTSGAIAGYPVDNVKISVYDGSYHDVDSSEIAFKIAGSRAFKDGMLKAKPVLLEPIMTVRVTIPDHHMGDINGDLSHRRGRILGMGVQDNMQVIIAEVPQSELFRYSAELRSMTAGQGSFEMEFCRYDIVPSNVAQKVIAAADKKKEDEE